MAAALARAQQCRSVHLRRASSTAVRPEAHRPTAQVAVLTAQTYNVFSSSPDLPVLQRPVLVEEL
jgi:hypothetical protein